MNNQLRMGTSTQDAVLNCLRKEKVSVIVYLTDGNEVKGIVKSFDQYTILVESNEKLHLVYKHAVVSIEPVKHIGELLRKQQKRERSGEA